MARFIFVIFLSAGFAAGCSDFPQLDNAVSETARNADFPGIVPKSQILANANDVQISPQTTAGIRNRASGLRARAARLRGPVLSSATRARLRAAMARHR